MFRGLTAWFSPSVDDSVLDDWERHGGEVCEINAAQFIFSNDSEENDTKRLYTSEAYIKEHLAIFHSQFVKDCVKKGDRCSVVIGKYFLPPLTVRKLMKKKNMTFEWENNEAKTEKRNSQESQTTKKNSVVTKSTHSSSQSLREKSPVKNNKQSSSLNKSPPQNYSSTSQVCQPSLRNTSLSSQKSHSSEKNKTSSQIPSSNNTYQTSSSSSNRRNNYDNQLDSGYEYVPIHQFKQISGKMIFFDPTDEDWEVFKMN